MYKSRVLRTILALALLVGLACTSKEKTELRILTAGIRHESIDYTHIRRPIFPLDPDMTWSANMVTRN